MLTKQDLIQALPKHMAYAATDDLLDTLNNIPLDPEMAKSIQDNFVSYTSVLSEGRFKMEDYLNAVAFVSFKVMGYSNNDAYSRTFPQRYAALVAKGASAKDISTYVSAYAKGKLVVLITKQTVIPTWVLNQGAMQEAINHALFLMTNAKSEMVQVTAAAKLMDVLKPPEPKEVNINIGAKEDSALTDLRATMRELAQHQQDLIGQGVNTRTIAHQKLTVSHDVDDAEVSED